jgi:hypothetical protein
MDIAAALTAVTASIGMVKALKDLERTYDTAELKAQMAEIYNSLADVKMALTDANTTIHERDQKIRELVQTIEDMQSGETCPICGTGRMKVTKVKPHPLLGVTGLQERTVVCQNADCKHIEKMTHDPAKRMGS